MPKNKKKKPEPKPPVIPVDDLTTSGTYYRIEETFASPTISTLRSEVLLPDISQILDRVYAIEASIHSNDWLTAHQLISDLFIHIDEVTGPAIAAAAIAANQ